MRNRRFAIYEQLDIMLFILLADIDAVHVRRLIVCTFCTFTKHPFHTFMRIIYYRREVYSRVTVTIIHCRTMNNLVVINKHYRSYRRKVDDRRTRLGSCTLAYTVISRNKFTARIAQRIQSVRKIQTSTGVIFSVACKSLIQHSKLPAYILIVTIGIGQTHPRYRILANNYIRIVQIKRIVPTIYLHLVYAFIHIRNQRIGRLAILKLLLRRIDYRHDSRHIRIYKNRLRGFDNLWRITIFQAD